MIDKIAFAMERGMIVADHEGMSAREMTRFLAVMAVIAMRDPPDEVLLGAGEPYSGKISRAEGLQARRDAWNKMIDIIVPDGVPA